MSNYLINKRKFENEMRYGILYRESENNKFKSEVQLLESDFTNMNIDSTVSDSNINNEDEEDEDDDYSDKLINDYFKQKKL